MKPEMKLEGDVLKLQVSESLALDSDQDGVTAVKGSITMNLELDGSEVADELLKSTSLAKMIAEKLAALGLKI